MSVDKILEEREKTHGDFKDHSILSQSLKEGMRDGVNWGNISLPQAEALEMVVHKIARILSGDANYKDHWDDIAGYATVVSRSLK